jgi:hypothetical protein
MQEMNPTKLLPSSLPHKLRVVHSVNRKERDENRSTNVTGDPGLTLPKSPAYSPKGYSTDAVPGNYQGL